MDQQWSLCCNTFLTVTQSYHSKVTPIGTLPAEKIAEAVMLYVFTIALPADRTKYQVTVSRGNSQQKMEAENNIQNA